MRFLIAFVALSAAVAQKPDLTPETIMARVAKNQDRAQKERSQFVYHQRIFIRVLGGDHSLKREELSEYTVTPGLSNTERQLENLSGKFTQKRKVIPYNQDGPEPKGALPQADHEIVSAFRQSIIDERSRDGVSYNWFPLTSEQMSEYDFKIVGEETHQGVSVWRISFVPKQHGHSIDIDTDTGPWAGEALISKDDFEPIRIDTHLAYKIPAAIRIGLGTNEHGIGGSVSYKKVGDGVWFPSTFGTEFSLRVLFFYSRIVTVSMTNTDFKRTKVDSTITFTDPK